MTNNAPQVHLLGKTNLAKNQGHFYVPNDQIIYMAAGDRHTIIVTGSGRVFAFGDNSSGQLGLGHTDNVEEVLCIESLTFDDTGEKVILAACGRESSLVATNRGSLYSFGSNNRSQLGIESKEATFIHSQPVKVGRFRSRITWKQISMGAEHACALTDDGQVYIWGSNEDGQCGQPRKYDTIKTPRELRLEYSVNTIEDGQLFLFGNNDDRQLGRFISDQFIGPVKVSVPDRVKAVACGNQHTVVLTGKGRVYTCGRGDRGQLGLGPKILMSECFELIEGLPKRLTAIAVGEGHTVILGSRGDIYAFGDGKHGKLGYETQSDEYEPYFIDKFKGYYVLKIVCGGCQTVVLAKKKKELSVSEENIGNETVPYGKSNSRNMTNTNLRHVKFLETSNNGNPSPLRIGPNSNYDSNESDNDSSGSVRSEVYTRTINEQPAIRGNDEDSKRLRTGVFNRTVSFNKETDDLTKTNNRLPSVDKTPVHDTRLDHINKQNFEDRSSSEERNQINPDDDTNHQPTVARSASETFVKPDLEIDSTKKQSGFFSRIFGSKSPQISSNTTSTNSNSRTCLIM